MPPKDYISSTNESRPFSPTSVPSAMFLELEMEELDKLERQDYLPPPPCKPPSQHDHGKTVRFSNRDEVHEIDRICDMDLHERRNVWYSGEYLRSMRHNMLLGDDLDGDATGNDSKLTLYLTAKNVRRGRNMVLTAQARQACQSTPSSKWDDDNIKEEYRRVTEPCQQQAAFRGQRMAAQAAKIWAQG